MGSDNKYNEQKSSINFKYRGAALDNRGASVPVKLTAKLNLSANKAHLEWTNEDTADVSPDAYI